LFVCLFCCFCVLFLWLVLLCVVFWLVGGVLVFFFLFFIGCCLVVVWVLGVLFFLVVFVFNFFRFLLFGCVFFGWEVDGCFVFFFLGEIWAFVGVLNDWIFIFLGVCVWFFVGGVFVDLFFGVGWWFFCWGGNSYRMRRLGFCGCVVSFYF